eukprot:COSAG06_NODE_7990_length_2309_cov_2.532579_1_plen_457_part_00
MRPPAPPHDAAEGVPAELEIEEGDPGEQDGILAPSAFAGSALRIGYHGTDSGAALNIMTNGFRPSADGMLGAGVYWSDDVDKAKAYTHDGSILRVQVKVGKVKRIDRQGHPLQKTWHLTHHTAWLPAQAHLPAADRMVPSGLSENCTHDPSRLRVVGLSTDSGETWKAMQIGAELEPLEPEPEPEPEREPCHCPSCGGVCSCSLQSLSQSHVRRACGSVAALGGVVLIFIGSARVRVDADIQCQNVAGWVDSQGDDCSFYEREKERGDSVCYVTEPLYEAGYKCCVCAFSRSGTYYEGGICPGDPRWVNGSSTLACGPFWSSFRAGAFCVWLGVACIIFGITLGSGRILSGNRGNDTHALVVAAYGVPITLGITMFLYAISAFEPQEMRGEEMAGMVILCLFICSAPFVVPELKKVWAQLSVENWFENIAACVVYVGLYCWAVMWVFFDLGRAEED